MALTLARGRARALCIIGTWVGGILTSVPRCRTGASPSPCLGCLRGTSTKIPLGTCACGFQGGSLGGGFGQADSGNPAVSIEHVKLWSRPFLGTSLPHRRCIADKTHEHPLVREPVDRRSSEPITTSCRVSRRQKAREPHEPDSQSTGKPRSIRNNAPNFARVRGLSGTFGFLFILAAPPRTI
ncbi:hypothetical protein GQ53DRAFT_751147 [Thozetella sp. PMI_491]|nr:hypothetical protein GQ53DRAFT_751147 [Thozetella sp. PMI_491]